MADEIIKELWGIKDAIAEESGYDVDALADRLQKRVRAGEQKVVDLSALKLATARQRPPDEK